MTEQKNLSKQALLWQLTLATLPENPTQLDTMQLFTVYENEYNTPLEIMRELAIALKGKTAKWIYNTLISGLTKSSASIFIQPKLDDMIFNEDMADNCQLIHIDTSTFDEIHGLLYYWHYKNNNIDIIIHIHTYTEEEDQIFNSLLGDDKTQYCYQCDSPCYIESDPIVNLVTCPDCGVIDTL